MITKRKGWGKSLWIGAIVGFAAFAIPVSQTGDLVQPQASIGFGAAGAGLGALGGLLVKRLSRHHLVYMAPGTD